MLSVRPGHVSEWSDIFVNKMIHENFHLYCLSELLEALCTHSKVNLMFFVISEWKRNFWVMLENSSVDGERFKMKTHVKNVSGIWINADVAQDQKGIGQI